jgi:transposase-like protein
MGSDSAESEWVKAHMLTQTLHCPLCGRDHLISNGYAKNGKLRFQCKACKKHGRQHLVSDGYDEQAKARVLAAYHERVSIRGLRQVLGVSRNTIAA